MNPAAKKLHPIRGKNKRQAVINELTSLARSIGVGGKLPTMLELSSILQVAIGTLDDCLASMESRGIIHRKHGSGIYVTPRIDQKRIALVFGRNIFSPGSSPFYSILLNDCLLKAMEHNFRFSFYLDCPDLSGIGGETPVHQDLGDAIEEKKIDGIVAISRNSPEQEQWLLQQNIPMVSLGLHSLNPHRASFDDDRLIEMGVEALMRSGCKSIGLIGVYPAYVTYFRRALKKYGVSTRRDWIVCPKKEVDYLEDHQREATGQKAAQQIFTDATTMAKKAGSLPDGLVITDDMITLGVCTELTSLGLKIGKDLKIASHANKGAQTLAKWEKDMILLESDPQAIVDAILQLLETLIKDPDLPAQCILLKPVQRTAEKDTE